MNAKIIEIFQSIQGEGIYAGVRQVFVRFFECNMHCTWCDTPHSIGDTTRNYQEMNLDHVMDQIRKLSPGCHSVSLTGGEPLMQKDFIKSCLPKIKNLKLKTYLETNGIFYQELAEIIDDIDIVAMDFKLPSSTKEREYWKEHTEFLRISRRSEVFVKAVITSDTKKADVETSIDIVRKIDPKMIFILQPNTFELKNGVMTKCKEFHELCLKSLPNTRVMPQMHKFMNVR